MEVPHLDGHVDRENKIPHTDPPAKALARPAGDEGGTGMFLLPVIKKVTQRVMVTIFSILEIVGLPRIEDKKADEGEEGA